MTARQVPASCAPRTRQMTSAVLFVRSEVERPLVAQIRCSRPSSSPRPRPRYTKQGGRGSVTCRRRSPPPPRSTALVSVRYPAYLNPNPHRRFTGGRAGGDTFFLQIRTGELQASNGLNSSSALHRRVGEASKHGNDFPAAGASDADGSRRLNLVSSCHCSLQRCRRRVHVLACCGRAFRHFRGGRRVRLLPMPFVAWHSTAMKFPRPPLAQARAAVNCGARGGVRADAGGRRRCVASTLRRLEEGRVRRE